MSRRKSVLVAVWVVLSALSATPLPAVAEPKPSRKELTEKEKRLVDQLEVLTEQHNGLVVRLNQARRAAKVAGESAERAQKQVEDVREQVIHLAAEGYKSGNLDPVVAMASSDDPQVMLDQYSTLAFFGAQGDMRLTRLLNSLQSFNRSKKAAQNRIEQVGRLNKDADDKRKTIQDALKSVRDKLGKPPTSPKDPPPIVKPGNASEKAMKAVQFALSQLGVPYSWGGGNAKGPSFGTDQGANIKGFDCSGLTMYAYAQVGINLPHFTGDQWNAGVHITRQALQPGDLVFFHSDLHHMGMYIGEGKMVHAPQTGDVVKISTIDDRPFAGGVRVA